MEELAIREENILVNERAESSDEIIRKLGGLLYNNGYVQETYTQAVLDREKVFPTGLQTTILGFAIPHTDSIHVNHSAVAIATLASPVAFKAMDDPGVDIQVSMVMMLAISDPKKVVDTLTKVISILEYESTLLALKNATQKEEIQQTVREHISRMTQERPASSESMDFDH